MSGLEYVPELLRPRRATQCRTRLIEARLRRRSWLALGEGAFKFYGSAADPNELSPPLWLGNRSNCKFAV